MPRLHEARKESTHTQTRRCAAGPVFIEKRPGFRFRQVSPHSVVTKEGDRTAPGQFWQLSYSPIQPPYIAPMSYFQDFKWSYLGQK